MNLLEIKSELEFEQFEKELYTQKKINTLFYLGLKKENNVINSSTYVWTSNREPLNYTNWHPQSNKTDQCVLMHPQMSNFQWFDVPCNIDLYVGVACFTNIRKPLKSNSRIVDEDKPVFWLVPSIMIIIFISFSILLILTMKSIKRHCYPKY